MEQPSQSLSTPLSSDSAYPQVRRKRRPRLTATAQSRGTGANSSDVSSAPLRLSSASHTTSAGAADNSGGHDTTSSPATPVEPLLCAICGDRALG